MNIVRISLLTVAIVLVAAACSSTSLEQKPAPSAQEVKPSPAPAPTTTPAPSTAAIEQTPTAAAPIDALNDPKSLLARRSVFFEFDRSSINDSDIPVVEAHARYLVDHLPRSVRIEGNCDERGGREYNLALGQRRADAVRERLKVLGVAMNRVETISLGKEKPRNAGHDETAWAENRRADILYK